MVMGKIGKSAILAILATASTVSSSYAEQTPRITIVVTPNPVVESESTQLRIEVKAEGSLGSIIPTFEAPDFTIAGTGQSGGMTSIMSGGKITTETKKVFNFILMPKKAGNLAIRNIKIQSNGKTYSQPDVLVKVSAEDSQENTSAYGDSQDSEEDNPAAPGAFQGQTPRPGNTTQTHLPNTFNSDFTVVASLSKTSAYVGEPVIVEYYLYDFGHLRSFEIQKMPTFNGFWKEDLEIPTRYQYEDVYIKNRPMRKVFLGRFALFGIKPGKFSVDKLKVKGAYVDSGFFRMDDDADPMSIFLGGGPLRSAIHASQDVSLQVLPLPEADKPQNFGGAVGEFSLKISADKTNLPANTPLTVTITVEGRGNFQAIESFRIPFPQDFELYESSTVPTPSNPIGARRPLDSKKSFQYIVIPRKAGTFQIPAITWSYFNSNKKAYVNTSTQPLEIQVAEGSATNDSNITNHYLTTGNNDGNGGASPKAELRYLKSISTMSVKRTPFALIAVILMFINIILAMLLWRKKINIADAWKKLDPFIDAKNQLKQIKESTKQNWSNDLEECLFQILHILLKANPRGMTRNELKEAWMGAKLPHELFQKIDFILNTLDRERFAQSGGSDKARLIAEVEQVIQTAAKL